MRKALIITILWTAVLTTASCDAALNVESTPGSEVTFRIAATTKASVEEHEDEVGSVDVLVFRKSTGRLESSARATGTSVTVRVPVGAEMDCRTVANAPEGAFDGISTVAAYQDLRSRLSDNTLSSLVMTGRTVRSFSAEQEDVDVELTRLVSKVSIGSVSFPMLDDALFSGSSVSIMGAYLINACGSVGYDMTPCAEDWLCKSAWDAGLSPVTRDYLGRTGLALTPQDGAVELNSAFYACPNPTDNAVSSLTDEGWSARNTRLVLEAQVDGRTWYYPITLPSMESGKHYVVEEVRITGLGSETPDSRIDGASIAFSIRIMAWDGNDQEVVLE